MHRFWGHFFDLDNLTSEKLNLYLTQNLLVYKFFEQKKYRLKII
jgi:hypothetical protein